MLSEIVPGILLSIRASHLCVCVCLFLSSFIPLLLSCIKQLALLEMVDKSKSLLPFFLFFLRNKWWCRKLLFCIIQTKDKDIDVAKCSCVCLCLCLLVCISVLQRISPHVSTCSISGTYPYLSVFTKEKFIPFCGILKE